MGDFHIYLWQKARQEARQHLFLIDNHKTFCQRWHGRAALP
jgi:hypothetical protein